jgi:hypothetical protein
MSYVQTVLADRPAGFWMITAPSGTSETDLSGNGKTATITEATDLIDRGYRPLVTGSSSDIAYRFYNSNHKLTYPAMEAWEVNRNHIPFSVEFTFQPVGGTRESILFAPQAASSAYVMENGIYCVNNSLRFVVSNGSDTSPATFRAVTQKYLEPGTTYHVVAVYDTTKISLYVDGKLVDSADLSQGPGWSHTTANFVTMANRPPTATETAEFIIDGVSFYRQALDPTSINNHYFMSTPNVAEVDIVNSLGGKIIKINDEDRTKIFDWSGASLGWKSNAITLTDVIVNDDGSVGLKKIPPVELRTSPSYYGNLLTWNQATAENGVTTGITNTYNPGALTYTFTAATDQVYSGSYAFKVTYTSGTGVAQTNFGIAGGAGPAVEPGKTYTATARIRCSAARNTQVAIDWWTAGGAYIVSNVHSVTAVANTWESRAVTATAPANAASCTIGIVSTNPVSGDSYWFDELMVREGSSTTWNEPNDYRIPPGIDASDHPKNLVGTLASRVDGGLNSWVAGTNCTAAHAPTIMHNAGGSARMSSNAAGTMQLYWQTGISGIVPGQKISGVLHSLAGSLTRSVGADIYFYNQSGGFLSAVSGSGTTNSTSAWTKHTVTATAPVGAVSCRLGVQVFSTAAANELHYIDSAAVYLGAETNYYEGAYNIDEINLRDSMFIKVRNAGRYLGKSQGAFGFHADFTAIENDNIQEQCLASISNTAGDSVIEIVKKSDKNLYLRYKYLNTAGDLTTTEASWGAISSLLATMPYFYVEWGLGILSLYVNTTSSPAQIAFDNGVKAPQFDENSYLHLGAGADELRTWNNYFKLLKLYPEVQDSSLFTSNKTSVNGFTAKLGSSLNVSQSGLVKVSALTGSDGTESVQQTQIYWSPRNSNISVTTSVDDTSYTAPTNGREFVSTSFPTNLPTANYAKVVLTTDDSYYNPVKLNELQLIGFYDSVQYSENSLDLLESGTRRNFFNKNLPMIRQDVENGARVTASTSVIILDPVNDTTNTSIPTGGSGATTAGPTPLIRTVEFWLYPETQGYYVYYDGTEHSMRYYDVGGFTTTGFTTLYVDGVSTANAATSTTWYNRWHHIVLTNASTQINLITANMNFGIPAPAGTQSSARYQNVSYYSQTFTAQQVLANYKAYLGDVTTGSFSDAPGSRTVADSLPRYYSNIWNSQTISV